jgi:hypothetical protein
MSNISNGDNLKSAGKTYYYKRCPHCWAPAHVDNTYCGKCKKALTEPGAVQTFYKTEVDPDLPRFNLDHPNGCPSCGLGCHWCYSFGEKKPSEKARCDICDKARAVCCIKSRKLPTITDAMPELSVREFIYDGSEDMKKIREAWAELFAEKVGECWSHNKEMSELWDKKEAG